VSALGGDEDWAVSYSRPREKKRKVKADETEEDQVNDELEIQASGSSPAFSSRFIANVGSGRSQRQSTRQVSEPVERA
jgi:hypothetical protein